MSNAKRFNLTPEKQRQLDKLLQEEQLEREVGIPRRPDLADVPLSFAQERLWLLEQVQASEAVCAYNETCVVRFRGVLDRAALERSWVELVGRHEVWRTVFTEREGRPFQQILPSMDIPLVKAELPRIPVDEEDCQALFREMAHAEARIPFDLARGPLLRARLLGLSPHDHALVLTIHHIVFDAWSFNILLNELTALYLALSAGRENPIPPLSVQYADFASWQRKELSGEPLQKLLAYWKKQLDGHPPLLALPTDRLAPPTPTAEGAERRRLLSPELSKRLNELARSENTTLFSVLLTALEVLLHRYTGEQDLLIGAAVAGRPRAELESLMGFFVNTLVLRGDLSGDPTVRQLLKQSRERFLEAVAHEALPFDRLVAELQPDRQPGRMPLIRVFLNLVSPIPPTKVGDLIIETQFPESGVAKFNLTLFVEPKNDQLELMFQYSTDLFDAATIERMLGHIEQLLHSMVANPEQRISTLPLLVEAERHQLLVEWNDTQADFATDRCIHELIEEQATQTPDVLALTYGEQRLTYGELNRRANQLGHHLRSLGVKRGMRVGVCVERSLEMVVGLLAVWKAGGTYVPIDPGYPTDRINFMLDVIAATVLITEERLRSSFLSSTKIVCLDSDPVHLESTPDRLISGLSVKDIAYVIFTSGSAGKPKGVEIPHAGLLNLVFWHHRAYSVTFADRATQLAGMGFDASVWELWPYLSVGASVYFPDEETRSSPPRLRDWLLANQITISFAPTPIAERLLALPWPKEHSLRRLLTGADRLHHPPSEELGFAFFNNYGPTESSVVATYGLIKPNGTDEDRPPPIGRPISNTQIYVLDTHQQLVPIGVSGELYIGGASLAIGYLGRPELTAEKFVPHPFGNGERLYRTGDLARYQPDGNIEYLGRIDFQVKIRGFRIELGEIEAALGKHEAVKEAVVMAREDVPGNKQLVAYVVVARPPKTPTAMELIEHLQRTLPGYMVPAVFIVMEILPLTPNGKVDRKALPAPDQGPLELTDDPPGNYWEAQLVTIWERVLGRSGIGINSNLFLELGADSLTTARAAALIRRLFKKEIHPIRFLQINTIKEQANALLELDDEDDDIERSSLVTIEPGDSNPPLFLVHGAGGTAFSYVTLAKHLGTNRPILAFQDPHTKGGKGFASVEETAEHFLSDLRRLPKTPVFLGGWSFGGTVAFEMANRLVAEGRQILGLILFDTRAPVGLSEIRIAIKRFIRQRLLRHFPKLSKRQPFIRNIQTLPPLHRLAMSAIIDQSNNNPALVEMMFPGMFDLRTLQELSANDMWELVYRKLSSIDDSRMFAHGTDAAGFRQQASLWGNHSRIELCYAPKWKYPGTIVLLKGRGNESSLGWQQYATLPLIISEYDLMPTRQIPDPHNAMMAEVNIQLYCEDLRATLETLESGTS